MAKKKKAEKTQTVVIELTKNEIQLIVDALDVIRPDTVEQMNVASRLSDIFRFKL